MLPDRFDSLAENMKRMDLSPRARSLIATLEDNYGPLHKPPTSGVEEVKRLDQYVDGQALLVCIVATLLANVPPEIVARFEPEAEGNPEPPAHEPPAEPQTVEEANAMISELEQQAANLNEGMCGDATLDQPDIMAVEAMRSRITELQTLAAILPTEEREAASDKPAAPTTSPTPQTKQKRGKSKAS